MLILPMGITGCGMRDAGCGMGITGREMRDAGCGVRDGDYGIEGKFGSE